jgi:hypothetical protein
MSVVCEACGTRNRENAMFCSGCAGRLPGFAPSGPSALESMRTWQPPHTPPPGAPARPTGASFGILPAETPAETPAFWLRLGLLALAMSFGFIAWYLYITRKVAEPSLPTPIAAAALAPEGTTPAPPKTTAPTPASAPAPAVLDMPEMPAAPPAPEIPDMLAPAQTRAEKSAAAPAARTPSMSPAERSGATPSAAAVRRARAPAPTWPRDDPEPPVAIGPGPLASSPRAPVVPRDDPGPPIAIGPGPLVSSARAPVAPRDDPGPPIAIGPGPLVSTARVPVVPRDDPGPPIAAGPGPLFDYSARASRSR